MNHQQKTESNSHVVENQDVYVYTCVCMYYYSKSAAAPHTTVSQCYDVPMPQIGARPTKDIHCIRIHRNMLQRNRQEDVYWTFLSGKRLLYDRIVVTYLWRAFKILCYDQSHRKMQQKNRRHIIEKALTKQLRYTCSMHIPSFFQRKKNLLRTEEKYIFTAYYSVFMIMYCSGIFCNKYQQNIVFVLSK